MIHLTHPTPVNLLQPFFKRFPSIRHLARQLYALVPAQLRLGRDFWTWLAFWEQTEQWSLQQMQENQMAQLRQLLISLKKISPYYAESLSGTSINEISDLIQFQRRVQTLSRRTVRDQLGRILATDWQKHRLLHATTSGTTGLALEFYHEAADWAREWAAIYHQWRRVGFDPVTSIRAEFRGLTVSKTGVDAFPHSNMIRCSILDLDRAHIRHFADQIKRNGITFLHGYPSALYLLAVCVEQAGISFPQPRGILLASEMVYEWQLDTLKRVFPKARIHSFYGCAERTVLAGWCEKEETYHVLPQYALVEIDPQTNEVVGTNLYNTINGFVRYRMTDTILEPSWDPCPICHRPYVPRFKTIGGRMEDFLFSSERGWIPPAIITYPFKGLHAIQETQIYQSQPEEIVINFMTEQETSSDLIRYDQEQILKGLIHLFGNSTRFRFNRTERIDRSPSGKFKWVVSSLAQPGDPGRSS